MILLDTHTLVWMASDPEKLSKPAADIIQKFQSSLLVSAISAWEIALLYKRGRLLLPVPPDVFIDKALARHGIQELPITRACTVAAVALPDIHNDPFDRILVAEALQRRCRIITKDAIIPTYPGISVVW